jgi:Zn-dependent peptidase ImmA (M78 family)
MLKHERTKYREGNDVPPSNLTKSQVEAYAEKVANAFNFQVSDDPADLVALLGGRIRYQELREWADDTGSIFVHGEQDFDICLPYYTSPLRDRFTLCHELGHYFLHSEQGEIPIIATRRGSTRIEWESNWFAAALLMPRDEFKNVLANTDDLSRIAAHFGVSQDAARVRREAIGG